VATATVSNITNFGGSASGADAGWGDIGGGPGGGQNTDDFIEGTDSFGGRKTATGRGLAYTAGAGVDMSTTSTHIYTWINCKSIGALDLISNGGLTLRVGSSATNYRSFYIGGSDTVKAGWQVYVIDPTKTGSVADTGTPDMTSVTYIGLELILASAVGGTSDNILMDVIRYTTGPYVTGGTTGDRLLWSDIAATDASNAYGIIQERSGVYFAAGQLALGAPAATAGDCYLDDGGQVVVWEPKEYHNGTAVVSSLATDFNSFVIQEGTGTTDIEDGNLVGTGDDRSGTGGSVFQKATEGILGAANTNDLRLSVEGAITAIDFHGSTFKRFDRSVTLSNDATDGPNHVFAGCVFTESEQVVANRPVYRNCVFSSYSGTDAAFLWNANVNIKNSRFLANTDGTNDPAGIEHPNTGTFTHDGLTFSGNDFDVYNSSGGLVTINVTNGSNTSTDRTPVGTTTINVSVPVSFTAIESDGSAIQAVRVTAYLVADNSEVINTTTDASGVASTSFSGTTPADVYYRLRKSSPGATKYVNLSGLDTIASSTGLSVKRTMREDDTADPSL
jgi:hypothetical protein